MQEAFSVAFSLWGWSPGNPKTLINYFNYPILVIVLLTTQYGWYYRGSSSAALYSLGLVAFGHCSSANILAALNLWLKLASC